jgi:predicted nucleic acid-binding protein
MEKLLLDTNILVVLARGNEDAQRVRRYIDGLANPQLFISVVNVAEAESLVTQWGWGSKKIEALRAIVRRLVTIDIESNHLPLLEAYVHIDTYSKRKKACPKGNMLPQGAVKMGKNDLWLAATAYVLEATLLTMDADFDHLNGAFIQVQKF